MAEMMILLTGAIAVVWLGVMEVMGEWDFCKKPRAAGQVFADLLIVACFAVI